MGVFAEIFDSTAYFLKAKGITAEISKGNKATPTAVKQFQNQTGIELPLSFSAFYTEFANGYSFSWKKDEDIWGFFSMPNLRSLAKQQKEWRRNVRDFLSDPNGLDGCIDRPFRAEAFEILGRMDSWIPFWDEGNGDHFCVDSTDGRILYDQHDWFDGFGKLAKTNGIVAGVTLEDFLRSWSRFCFNPTSSLWWGQFVEYGAVKWEPKYFSGEFCRHN